ncbi:hypothetical protein KC363_g99 [Hortaea werneckii]|nr:hypothetical protein KC363_g99 [Hortaea werneckii]
MSMAGCEAKRAQGSDIAARARVMKQKQVIDAPALDDERCLSGLLTYKDNLESIFALPEGLPQRLRARRSAQYRISITGVKSIARYRSNTNSSRTHRQRRRGSPEVGCRRPQSKPGKLGKVRRESAKVEVLGVDGEVLPAEGDGYLRVFGAGVGEEERFERAVDQLEGNGD